MVKPRVLKKVGTVSVDSGTVIVADPSSILCKREVMAEHYKREGREDPNPEYWAGVTYKQVLDDEDEWDRKRRLKRREYTNHFQVKSPRAKKGEDLGSAGVATRGFGGDGTYPVYQLEEGSMLLATVVIYAEESKEARRILRKLSRATKRR
jgi:hypothetical protein